MKLLRSELLKLTTVRAPWVLLLASMILSAVAAAGFVGSGSLEDDPDRALLLGQAASFGTLIVAVIGILVVTNEYRHGTIMTTFLAEPSRVRVLVGKVLAAAVAGLVFAVAALVATAAVALPWLEARGESPPVDGQLAEAVGRVLLVFALTAVIGAAVGGIVHSQVGALVGYFVWIFVVESLVTLLSGLVFTDIGEPDPVTRFLPGASLSGIVGGEGNEFVLRAGWAALLALGYATALSCLAALSMMRRDPS